MSKSFKHIKNSGFRVPEGYFDSIEDQVMSKIGEENLKGRISDTGFDLPDNYFEGLEDRVMSKIDKPETKVVSLFSRKRLYYISGVAAAILILVSVLINRTTTSTEDINYEMVENYILDQDMSTYEIASLLTEDDLENSDFEMIDEVISEESLEDYLLDNIDLEEIIEQ